MANDAGEIMTASLGLLAARARAGAVVTVYLAQSKDAAADILRDCWIEAAVRGREKPSDHVPVWIELDA